MAWHWFALVAERPVDVLAVARASELDGRPAGFLAAWRVEGSRGGHWAAVGSLEQGRPAGSLGIDVRAVDPAGEAAWVSLALAPPGVRLLFDDPAVSWALRQVLAGPAREVMSTLTLDSAAIGGALTAVRGPSPSALLDDPFGRLFPTRVLYVEPGFVGRMPMPVGPGIQRYTGSPWPWDRFPPAVGTPG
jgi:hypothetical protein